MNANYSSVKLLHNTLGKGTSQVDSFTWTSESMVKAKEVLQWQRPLGSPSSEQGTFGTYSVIFRRSCDTRDPIQVRHMLVTHHIQFWYDVLVFFTYI